MYHLVALPVRLLPAAHLSHDYQHSLCAQTGPFAMRLIHLLSDATEHSAPPMLMAIFALCGDDRLLRRLDVWPTRRPQPPHVVQTPERPPHAPLSHWPNHPKPDRSTPPRRSTHSRTDQPRCSTKPRTRSTAEAGLRVRWRWTQSNAKASKSMASVTTEG
jgi:hypothetical protein